MLLPDYKVTKPLAKKLHDRLDSLPGLSPTCWEKKNLDADSEKILLIFDYYSNKSVTQKGLCHVPFAFLSILDLQL